MAAQLTVLGDVPAWRPETGHMLYEAGFLEFNGLADTFGGRPP